MKTDHTALRHAGAITALLALPMAAQAIPFQLGPVTGTVDTSLSAGLSLRTQRPDASLIGIANGGTGRSVNDDDGNLGFEKGDITSASTKASHDVELKYQNYGLFSRVSYFYDHTASEADRFEDRIGSSGQVDTARQRGHYELGPRGRDRLGSEFRLLDLFAYGNFDVAGHSLSLRFGKQVINWGESTFIGNSINVINPVDVARLRAPGAELKEALLPTPILSAAFQLTSDLSVEAIWLTAYDKTQIDPRGSFFSSTDILSDDGDRAVIGFARRNDQNQPVVIPINADAMTASVWLPRDGTREPSGSSTREQYGVAARYFSEPLNNTEFGFFYLNYHSRTPLVSAIRGGSTNASSSTATCSSSAVAGCRGSYFAEFPEHIDLYGVSFNTTAPFGVAMQGEYSYRPNQPVQRAAVEVLLAALGAGNNITGTDPATAAAVPVGTLIRGYERVDMHQFQATGTKAFGPTLGAQQFVLLGEAALNYLSLPEGQLFAGPGTALPAPGSANSANGSFQTEGGYASQFSWGYRAVARMDFESVIDAVQFSPRLVFAHDVIGVGPNFIRGTKAVTTGLGLNYLQRWQADLGYTAFFGGRTFSGTDTSTVTNPDGSTQPTSFATSANPNKDRDFFAVSVSYAF